MKIVDIEAFAVRFPKGDFFGGEGGAASSAAPERFSYVVQPGWRGIYSANIETMLVRITTDDGLVGWGEGQSPVGPEITARIVEQIIRPVILGRDARAVRTLRDEMYGLMNVRGHFGGFMLDAICGVDIALWDLKGKALGISVAELLGGPARDTVPAYVSGVRGGSNPERLETIERFRARGFSRFKLFAGFGVDEDLAILRALREAGGPELWLAVDTLWKYDANAALRLGRGLEELGVAWFEAPMDPEDVDGNAALAAALDVPVANGETQRTVYEFLPWFQKRALDVVQPDIGRCGITEGMRVVDLARAYHTQVVLHMGMAGPPLLAASLQVAAAMAHVSLAEYQPVVLDAANTLLRAPIRCEAGLFPIPQGPGLGIELDDDAVTRIRVPATH